MALPENLPVGAMIHEPSDRVPTLTGTLTSVRSILQSIQATNPLGMAVLRAKSDATGTLR